MTVAIDILDDKHIRLVAGPRYGDLIRQIPGSRHRSREQDWTAPLSWGTCITARGIFGAELDVGQSLADWSMQMLERRNSIIATKTGAVAVPHLDERLYPFQRTGASFLAMSGRALLADEMGTGKGVQTIAALRALSNSLPVLIICTSSMKHKWAEEFGVWWPEVSTAVVSGSAAQRRKAIESGSDITIINWEALKTHSRLAPYGSIHLTEKQKEPKALNAIEWGTVVADEAHRMKDPRSQQTRAAWAVMHG